jgi:tetratricopeptide (TPR) repeat protein/2-polyprenyl-3-methyl-5-hydroxy-6-metoxy-1,4-benzoquinol methylase
MTPAPASVDSIPAASERFAVAMIDEGNALKKQGRIAEAMARYDAAVRADPQCAPAHLSRGNILLAGAQFEQARSAYQLAIACDPHYVAAHFNLGNLNYHAGEFAHALCNYQAAIGIRPQFADAFVGMANALASLGRTAEAMESCQQALGINPGHAEAHFNLGVLAMTQERRQEAATSLRKAIELRPDYAAAHRILGGVLSSLGTLDAAEAHLRRAWSLEPESGEIPYELALIFQYLGNYRQAVQLLTHALERAPNWRTKVAFANCVAHTRFTTNDPQVRAALTTCLTEAWATPHNICRSALSLVMLDARIASCVRLANESWPARVPRAVLFGPGALAALATDPLLHALLVAVPVNTIQFERFLTCARHALLEIASSKHTPDPSDVAALSFYAALARQCFINEFVFDCRDEERLAADTCRTTLLALLDTNAAVPPLLLLAVAAYFPLHVLRDANRLLAASKSGPVDEVLRQQVREPLEEQALRAGVECLTPIAGSVSEAVRDQYEQNPYPRWLNVQMHEQALHVNAELHRALPFAPPFTPMSDDSAPEVLIAGCGTGSDAILVAQRFRNVRALAIDLSLTSITHAKRKTQELGLTNIAYAQADILKLGDIVRTFDIIVSVGVLHHLADPFDGWRILLSRLRPGGFMFLGLYSQLARRCVIKAREFIAAGGYASTPDGIRRFRQDVVAQDTSVELRSLSNSQAFYSMSDCRDLAFHVQEQHLTLGQIESFLAESGLRFVGFELDLRVLNQYRARFPDDPSCTNLRSWARFEDDNPDTFTAMYRFWIHQPIRQ